MIGKGWSRYGVRGFVHPRTNIAEGARKIRVPRQWDEGDCGKAGVQQAAKRRSERSPANPSGCHPFIIPPREGLERDSRSSRE